ncbi:MAG: phytanoyl-CoA dioxygenase family protein [bacterium]|nr:phytanoyl-CoA dioxygenase family protein [bacterium]
MRRLDEREIESFFDRGYITVAGLFSALELKRMRSAFDRLERTAQSLGRTATHRGARFVLERDEDAERAMRIHRVVWCGAAEPVLSNYGRDPRILTPASQLLGSPEMNQLINQAHFKLPGDGVAFPWHQDSAHRRYGQAEWRDVNGRGSYVQTVIAIDDVTESNGPLRFIPCSGRSGHVPPVPGTDGRLPDGLVDETLAVPATMRAGSVLFFGPYVFHSSEPNRSARPRRVLINGFAYPGANSRDYPGCGTGRPVVAPPTA